MIIGSMNNPHKDLMKEVAWVAKHFDFLDLTLEVPMATPETINVKVVKASLKNFPVVGHTGWYLPIGSPFEELRVYAINEYAKCARVFSALGVEYVNVHFDTSMPMKKEKHTIDFNVWTLRRLIAVGKKYGVKVMVENTGGTFSRPSVLNYVFKKVPKLFFHLDIGHANIGEENQTPLLVRRFFKKIVHIHVSDNNGKGDQHLPIGRGNIKWDETLKTVKDSGYDNTITLEVLTTSSARLADKSKLRKIWDNL